MGLVIWPSSPAEREQEGYANMSAMPPCSAAHRAPTVNPAPCSTRRSLPQSHDNFSCGSRDRSDDPSDTGKKEGDAAPVVVLPKESIPRRSPTRSRFSWFRQRHNRYLRH
jgi:hypothetical protein